MAVIRNTKFDSKELNDKVVELWKKKDKGIDIKFCKDQEPNNAINLKIGVRLMDSQIRNGLKSLDNLADTLVTSIINAIKQHKGDKKTLKLYPTIESMVFPFVENTDTNLDSEITAYFTAPKDENGLYTDVSAWAVIRTNLKK